MKCVCMHTHTIAVVIVWGEQTRLLWSWWRRDASPWDFQWQWWVKPSELRAEWWEGSVMWRAGRRLSADRGASVQPEGGVRMVKDNTCKVSSRAMGFCFCSLSKPRFSPISSAQLCSACCPDFVSGHRTKPSQKQIGCILSTCTLLCG
jgi:hypothetical protein